jgi:hypothetical protein
MSTEPNWKEEYFKVSKFATQFEEQRDEARATVKKLEEQFLDMSDMCRKETDKVALLRTQIIDQDRLRKITILQCVSMALNTDTLDLRDSGFCADRIKELLNQSVSDWEMDKAIFGGELDRLLKELSPTPTPRGEER